MSDPVRIFISYSRKDLAHLEALETHLANLKRQQRIVVWTDQRLRPSTEWEPDLLGQLRSAEIVLLLVTPDLMASDFIHDVELKETLERHKNCAVKVVPVLVRPTDFEGHALARFQGLPRNFKPISEWPSRDQAWVEVVKGVRELVEILRLNSVARDDKTSHAPAPSPTGAHTAMKAPAALEKAKEPENCPALTLLHISDLHFGQARGEGRVHFDQLKVVGELLKDARVMREKLGSPDAILVTGDIAFSARPEQYQQADEWLKELATAVGVTSDKVWLVPGNHDVDRTLTTKPLYRKLAHIALRSDPTGLNDGLLKEHVAELASSLWPKLEPYATFARAWAAPSLSAASPFWRREITSPLGKLLLVGLNSCLLSLDETDTKANLALSQAQLHRLLEPMPDQALTLALLHHPPEWLLDGEALLKELQKGPHLLFCGHVHEAGGGVLHGLGQNARLRFNAGATHASPDEPARHEYAWIRLSKEGLNWYPRVYSTHKSAFKAAGDRLEDQQIHQRLDAGQLPKPLWEWLGRTDTPPPPLPPQPPRPPLIPDAWRKELLRRFEHLDLHAGRKTSRPRLDELYVTPKTNWLSPQEQEKQRKANPAAVEKEKSLPPRPLSFLLEHPEHTHFALRGGPGSGKSTFLRIAALENVRSDQHLPLLLQLKDFAVWLTHAGAKGESAELLLAWAGQELADFDLDAAGLHARLGHGETLWLLDGLDEIFDQHQRLRVARLLGRFAHGKLGKTERLIITSRPHALDDAQTLEALGLHTTTAHILDLDWEEQRLLLERWFGAIYEPKEMATARTEALRMLQHLDQHAYLTELRANPLLLTTMASLYYAGRRLPERRAELFERAILQLLERRFGPGSPEGSLEKVTRVRRALAHVARQMMEGGAVRELGDLEFRRMLEKGWCPEEADSTKRAQFIEKLALELGCHTGLLKLEGHPPVYQFSHLAMQEYLAAWSFGQETSPIAVVEKRLDEGTWRETILLTAGYLGMAGVERLIKEFLEALLERRGGGEKLCHRLEVAVQGAVEAPRGVLPAELERKIKTLAVEAMSDRNSPSPIRDRVHLGLALGRLGDPRLGLDKPDNWIQIPPGEFRMGSNDYDDEKPIHKVKLSKGFDMSRFPVTNHDFKAFVDNGGYSKKAWWRKEGWVFCQKEKLEAPGYWQDPKWNAPNQPVVGVSWYEADAFCRWMSTQRSRLPPGTSVVRLPTEAEWEYTARGKEDRTYPWGNEKLTPERANYDETGLQQTSPVGAFPLGATPEGLLDMAGNVWEWVEDLNELNSDSAPSDGRPQTESSGSYRVFRGGGWGADGVFLRAALRSWYDPGYRYNYVGFRVVRVSPVGGVP